MLKLADLLLLAQAAYLLELAAWRRELRRGRKR